MHTCNAAAPTKIGAGLRLDEARRVASGGRSSEESKSVVSDCELFEDWTPPDATRGAMY
jgi:hypothetical protein